MNLRPDERAALTDIERSKKTDSFLKKGVGLAAGAVSAGLGAGAASRILPFLNEYIPMDLALKGINKISPEIGRFLKKGQSSGLDIKEGLNFIKDQILPKEEREVEQPQQNSQNAESEIQFFETNYPVLAQGLMSTIQAGKNPQEAAQILKRSTALGRQVKDLEAQKGKKFEDYVVELFGNVQQSQSAQQPQEQMQPQGQDQQMQQPQSGQGVDPQLLQLVQSLKNSIQGMRGG